MSREINMDGPLSDEDRAYLLHRGQDAKVEFLDAVHGSEGEEPPRPEDFKPESAGDRPPGSPETPPLLTMGDADTIGDIDQSGYEQSEGGVQEAPYKDWTVAELKDELKERELPVSGNHQALVARLEEDDAAREGEQKESEDSE